MKRLLALSLLFVLACGDDDDHAEIDGGTPVFDSAVPVIDAAEMCAVPVPSEENCDYFLSCGCDTETDKCSIQEGQRGCSSFGGKAAGEACTQDSECGPASLCAQQDMASTVCMPFCDAAHPCAGETACYVQIPGLEPADEIELCGPTCDLLGQDCAASQGCHATSRYPVPGKGICVQAGEGGEGDACEIANDCAVGLTCIERDDTCHKFCDRDSNEPCSDGQTCEPLVGQPDVGYCKD